MQNRNIDYLIGKLKTKEGRAIATVKAIENGLDVGNDVILQALKYFIFIGDYEMAMKLPNNIPEAEILLLHFKPEAMALLAVYKNANALGFRQNKKEENSRRWLSDYFSFDEGDLKIAMKYFELGKKWEGEGKIGAAKYRYKQAVKFLMTAQDYLTAYNLATKLAKKYNNFIEVANQVYTKATKVFEGLCRYEEAEELEKLRGNSRGAQIYKNLADILRQS